MAGKLTLLGERSVGGVIPLYPALGVAASAAIPPLLAELGIDLAGLVKLAGVVGVKPPTLALGAAAAVSALVGLNAAVGVVPPSINLTATASLGFAAKWKAVLEGVKAVLSVTAQIDAIADAGGIYVFLYEGELSGMASAEVQSAIRARLGGKLTAPIYLPILVVDVSSHPGTKSALAKTFGT